MTKDELGRLVVTLTTGEDGEVLHLMAHTPDGPVPVWFEIPPQKGCRCGNSAKRMRVRFVGPRSVFVKRVPRSEVPE